jgi:predicted CoA-binding protein
MVVMKPSLSALPERLATHVLPRPSLAPSVGGLQGPPLSSEVTPRIAAKRLPVLLPERYAGLSAAFAFGGDCTTSGAATLSWRGQCSRGCGIFGAMADTIVELRRILKTCRTVAVVGVSADWFRPSHFVAKYLLTHGYRMIPVNPRYWPSLESVPEPVDLVDVFRKTADVMPIAKSAVAIGAKCLWQQIGVINHEAAQLARDAGLDAVMDRCVKIEHARLFGGLHWAGVNTRVISARRPV